MNYQLLSTQINFKRLINNIEIFNLYIYYKILFKKKKELRKIIEQASYNYYYYFEEERKIANFMISPKFIK